MDDVEPVGPDQAPTDPKVFLTHTVAFQSGGRPVEVHH